MKALTKFTPEEIALMSLITVGGMMIMVLATGAYIAMFVADTLTFKIIVIVNAILGFVFLGATFIGTYQQWKQIKMIQGGADMLNILGDSFKEALKGGERHG